MTTKKLEKRLFGTNGVRGVAGTEMTPALALEIGLALGTMRPGTVAVGMDTRTSGPALASALKSGLLAAGCDVVDCGILPTPALQYIVRAHFDAGAMVTASHNPPEYNGVKFFGPDGAKLTDEQEEEIEALLGDIRRQDVHLLLSKIQKEFPKLVEEVTPIHLSLAQIH
ncbi:MAG: phosphoglucosamine mutase, partial [Methanolinea sp.]